MKRTPPRAGGAHLSRHLSRPRRLRRRDAARRGPRADRRKRRRRRGGVRRRSRPRLAGALRAWSALRPDARRSRASGRISPGAATGLRVRMRQHALSAVNDVPAAPGRARTATSADTDWLIERQIAFIVEAGIHDRPERVREQLPARIARGDFRIWDDGRPVAYAGFNDAAPDFARIAPVYTMPDCRGRGYATALVAELSRELLARGQAQALPHDRRRESDVECDLRTDRISRRERRLRPRFRRDRDLAHGGAAIPVHDAARGPGSRARRSSSTPAPRTTRRACCALPSAIR